VLIYLHFFECLCWLSRDNLDENGWRRSECEAAAGSGVMISLDLLVRKHFLRGAISSDMGLSDR
jgi:hypothetical protein